MDRWIASACTDKGQPVSRTYEESQMDRKVGIGSVKLNAGQLVSYTEIKKTEVDQPYFLES